MGGTIMTKFDKERKNKLKMLNINQNKINIIIRMIIQLTLMKQFIVKYSLYKIQKRQH